MKFIEPSFKGVARSGSLKGQLVFGNGLSFIKFTESYKKEKGREGDWYLDLADCEGHVTVYEHTIGQFIGKLDMSGRKIYSGDTIVTTFESGLHEIAEVIYDTESCSYLLKIEENETIKFNMDGIKELILM